MIDGQTFPVFDDMARADVASLRIAPIQYLADRPEATVTLTNAASPGFTTNDVTFGGFEIYYPLNLR